MQCPSGEEGASDGAVLCGEPDGLRLVPYLSQLVTVSVVRRPLPVPDRRAYRFPDG